MAIFYFSGQVHQDGPLDAEQLLRGLSVTRKLIGFRYAVYMIEQVADNPDNIYLITKRLYPDTARHFNATVTSVERALRNVVHSVWERTDHGLLEYIAGTALRNPPTNSEFIDMLASYLRKNHSQMGQ